MWASLLGHLDGFVNTVTGLAMAAWDKAANVRFEARAGRADRYLDRLART
ncbi:MAG: hypothetical protein MJD61_04155 [Proteobacteria bacterium]|nr:hypothetical protein [Pseudomonadota bacterium]